MLAAENVGNKVCSLLLQSRHSVIFNVGSGAENCVKVQNEVTEHIAAIYYLKISRKDLID